MKRQRKTFRSLVQMGQTDARGQELQVSHMGGKNASTWAVIHCFPGVLAGNCIRHHI